MPELGLHCLHGLAARDRLPRNDGPRALAPLSGVLQAQIAVVQCSMIDLSSTLTR
jgi:hypothetical protein